MSLPRPPRPPGPPQASIPRPPPTPPVPPAQTSPVNFPDNENSSFTRSIPPPRPPMPPSRISPPPPPVRNATPNMSQEPDQKAHHPPPPPTNIEQTSNEFKPIPPPAHPPRGPPPPPGPPSVAPNEQSLIDDGEEAEIESKDVSESIQVSRPFMPPPPPPPHSGDHATPPKPVPPPPIPPPNPPPVDQAMVVHSPQQSTDQQETDGNTEEDSELKPKFPVAKRQSRLRALTSELDPSKRQSMIKADENLRGSVYATRNSIFTAREDLVQNTFDWRRNSVFEIEPSIVKAAKESTNEQANETKDYSERSTPAELSARATTPSDPYRASPKSITPSGLNAAPGGNNNTAGGVFSSFSKLFPEVRSYSPIGGVDTSSTTTKQSSQSPSIPKFNEIEFQNRLKETLHELKEQMSIQLQNFANYSMAIEGKSSEDHLIQCLKFISDPKNHLHLSVSLPPSLAPPSSSSSSNIPAAPISSPPMTSPSSSKRKQASPASDTVTSPTNKSANKKSPSVKQTALPINNSTSILSWNDVRQILRLNNMILQHNSTVMKEDARLLEGGGTNSNNNNTSSNLNTMLSAASIRSTPAVTTSLTNVATTSSPFQSPTTTSTSAVALLSSPTNNNNNNTNNTNATNTTIENDPENISAKKQYLLRKIEYELLKPKKISQQRSLESALDYFHQFIQQNEQLLLHYVNIYDRYLSYFIDHAQDKITTECHDLSNFFQEHTLHTIKELVKQNYEKQKNHILSIQKTLTTNSLANNQKLCAFFNDKFHEHLTIMKEIALQYSGDEDKNNSSSSSSKQHQQQFDPDGKNKNYSKEVRDFYAQKMDLALYTVYEKIYDHIEKDELFKLRQQHDEQIFIFKRKIFFWKLKYKQLLEDRLNYMEIVMNGHYTTYLEELYEELEGLTKIHSLMHLYYSKLEYHLEDLIYKHENNRINLDDFETLKYYKLIGEEPSFPQFSSSEQQQLAQQQAQQQQQQQQQQQEEESLISPSRRRSSAWTILTKEELEKQQQNLPLPTKNSSGSSSYTNNKQHHQHQHHPGLPFMNSQRKKEIEKKPNILSVGTKIRCLAELAGLSKSETADIMCQLYEASRRGIDYESTLYDSHVNRKQIFPDEEFPRIHPPPQSTNTMSNHDGIIPNPKDLKNISANKQEMYNKRIHPNTNMNTTKSALENLFANKNPSDSQKNNNSSELPPSAAAAAEPVAPVESSSSTQQPPQTIKKIKSIPSMTHMDMNSNPNSDIIDKFLSHSDSSSNLFSPSGSKKLTSNPSFSLDLQLDTTFDLDEFLASPSSSKKRPTFEKKPSFRDDKTSTTTTTTTAAVVPPAPPVAAAPVVDGKPAPRIIRKPSNNNMKVPGAPPPPTSALKQRETSPDGKTLPSPMSSPKGSSKKATFSTQLTTISQEDEVKTETLELSSLESKRPFSSTPGHSSAPETGGGGGGGGGVSKDEIKDRKNKLAGLLAKNFAMR